MAVKALTAGHAEFAAHATTGLRRNAQGCAVIVRNHHSLYRTILEVFLSDPSAAAEIQATSVGASDRKKVFLCPVRGYLEASVRSYTDFIFLGQLRSGSLERFVISSMVLTFFT